MTPTNRACGPHRRERGAVLVVSLILLVILTLLGLSAMNTTQLGERMAANSQEATRAFQAAETGLTEAFNDADSWDVAGTDAITKLNLGGSDNDATHTTTFLGWSPPPTGALYSATSFQAANFNFQSVGTTGGGIIVTLNGGAYQIAPKQ